RWFLPGLMATRAPIPLGGTSNHIRRDVLVGMGAWDAWNVTEDADLGIRLARHGWRTAMLGSTTLEEANSDAINWVKQRSRWYKGYLQSVLVALRRPRELHRAIGTRGVGGLLLFVLATPVLALLNPVFWGLTALWWLGEPAFVAALFPAPTYYLGTAAWMLGTLAAVHSGVAVARAAGKPQLAPAALVVPAYWVLMSLAAAKAVLQLVRRPSYWEKTTHGLDAPATVSGGVS
ncbi:MAG: glycosyltransferase family 2 protein, partial [Pseudonocardia sediminis]